MPTILSLLDSYIERNKSGHLRESPWTKAKYIDIRGALKIAARCTEWSESISDGE